VCFQYLAQKVRVHVSAKNQYAFGSGGIRPFNALVGKELFPYFILGDAVINRSAVAGVWWIFDDILGTMEQSFPDIIFQPLLCGHDYVLPWEAGIMLKGYFLSDREAARIGLFTDQVHLSPSYRLGQDRFELGFNRCNFGGLDSVRHVLPTVIDCEDQESHSTQFRYSSGIEQTSVGLHQEAEYKTNKNETHGSYGERPGTGFFRTRKNSKFPQSRLSHFHRFAS
jgi:hypothetical protein